MATTSCASASLADAESPVFTCFSATIRTCARSHVLTFTEPFTFDRTSDSPALTFNVFVIGAPFGPPIEATAAGMAAVIDGLRPWACGGLLNFVGTATPEQVGRLWSCADRARLLAVRDRVDPTGRFATNIHIG